MLKIGDHLVKVTEGFHNLVDGGSVVRCNRVSPIGDGDRLNAGEEGTTRPYAFSIKIIPTSDGFYLSSFGIVFRKLNEKRL
jgi:hypothetical protein